MGTVLVVDDQADIRSLVRLTLELDGHDVVTAASGAEALDAVRAGRPDVVVLDVTMPGKSGWEVLAELKATDDADVASIPVILLTARVDDLARIRGGIEGAIRYLTKPFSPAGLRREVGEALCGEPEATKRRRAQMSALEQLARRESGTTEPPPGSRPNLTRLGRVPARGGAVDARLAPNRIERLSVRQREVLAAVGSSESVSDAAGSLNVSRANVYASLGRIARKLDIRSVPDLVRLVRAGGIPPES